MSGTLKEWLAKAEGDFGAAQSLMRVRKNPNYDAVCFHAQQCIEKLMKAVLIRRKVVPPRMHDLVHLSQLIHRSINAWSWESSELRELSQGAVVLRYPGLSATKVKALNAMRICRSLRKALYLHV